MIMININLCFERVSKRATHGPVHDVLRPVVRLEGGRLETVTEWWINP